MDLIQSVLELNSFKEFNKMQKAALKYDIFTKNIVISAPTTSGKTLISELCALNSIINRRRKVIYTCPLRALASEHYNSFKKKYSKALNIKAMLSTGDFDSSSKYLQNYDIIFSTNEKIDSLLRHRADWLSSVGLLVADEVHELDSDRGPTLEMVVTKLKMLNPKLQLLALSATIPNAQDIANWLDAELIESNFRPVKLKEGVYFDETVSYNDNSTETIDSEHSAILALVEDTLQKGKQPLVFVNARKISETTAKAVAHLTQKHTSASEATKLKKASEQALNALEQPTEQCKLVADLISKGVCFHNAGLLMKQREIVENLFRERLLKVIVATPTLAAGINMPAHTVLLPYLHRYTPQGMVRIPVREVKQQCGRAGRTGYDKEGRAILIAKSETEKDYLFDYYINAEPEEVHSKLSIEPVLRMHTLAAIASNFVFDLASLEKFFSKTFYAFQYGDLTEMFQNIMEIIKELEEMGFVYSTDREIAATKLGKRVSELYLDPVSAHSIIQSIKLTKPKKEDPYYLYTLSNTTEASPLVSIPKKREPELWEEIQNCSSLPVDVEKEQYTDNNLLRKFNTTLLLQDWINEIPEAELLKRYSTQPGILHAKLQILDWLSYAASELARIIHNEKEMVVFVKIRKRLKHGVREELLVLTELRNIGRVRARLLWKNNIKTIATLKKIDIKDLSRILPPKIAESVKQQLGKKKN